MSEEQDRINLANEIFKHENDINDYFLLVMAWFVLLMQFGFAFLEAGSVRAMNTVNIIWKNILDFFIGALVFWAVGFAFAFGDLPEDHPHASSNRFIGLKFFFDMGNPYEPERSGFAFWIFMFSFAVNAATIVSGSVAERSQIGAYIIYTTFITGFIFPVVAHWSWTETGWLRNPKIENFYRHSYSSNGTFFYDQTKPVQFIDFAGSAVVHCTGGAAGLIGAWFMGPRGGRFGKENEGMFFGHSVPLINLGFLFLFIGFLCFNGGSELAIVGPGNHGTTVAKIFINTILGGSAGGIVSLTYNYLSLRFKRGYADISLYYLMNGALAGWVAMAAGSNSLTQGYSLLIGSLGALFMIFSKNLLEKFEIDDPLTASPIHLGGGLVGIFLTPIFKQDGLIAFDICPVQELEYVRKYPNGTDFRCDFFEWKVLGWNIAGTLAILVWTMALSGAVFWGLKKLKLLRVPPSIEKYGLDKLKHGEDAYPLDAYFG